MAYAEASKNSHQSIISAHNVVVTGGTFIQQKANDGRKSSFDILKDAVAPTAFHDSGQRVDPPKCHPNTRVAVLDKILNWIQRRDPETRDRYIMWLTGAAGAGKSAIAQSLIELCLEHGLVIASFFFGRADGSRNHSGSLIATLVYQIYRMIPQVQTEILSVIDEDPLIFTKRFEQQFGRLIIQPLSRACSSGISWDLGSHCVIVIDGLDECLDREAQQQVLRIISNAIRQGEIPILFLIASRPEYEIKLEFSSTLMDGIHARLYLDDMYETLDDIRTYFNDSFEKIRTTHPFKSRIPSSWPDKSTQDSLVQRSSGQFIYAATVVRYVQSIRHQPHHRLETVMNLQPAQGDLPFAQLDALYTKILSYAADIDRVLYALSIHVEHVLDQYAAMQDLEQFMSLEPGELDILFCDLSALVSIQYIEVNNDRPPVKTLRLLHASLSDFLLDPMRSGEYFIDGDRYRSKMFADILHYVALPSDVDAMDERVTAVSDFFEYYRTLCQTSTELLQQASSFPLEKIYDALSNSTAASNRMAYFIPFRLIPFFKHMSRLNEEWLLIWKQQNEALDKVFLSKIPSYYTSGYLTALLCLVCHVGQEDLVPWQSMTPQSNRRILPLFSRNTQRVQDILLLGEISLFNIGTDQDEYRHCAVRFLQDSDRSGSLAVGANAYARAALYFIEQLEQETWLKPVGGPVLHESISVNQITHYEGQWILDSSKRYETKDHARSACFSYLNYILCFLPRAGNNIPLVEHCQGKACLTDQVEKVHPVQAELVRRAMVDYLDRVEPVDSK